MKKVILLWFCSIVCFYHAFSQSPTPIPLSGAEAFESPGKNWIIVSDLSMDLDRPTAKFVSGNGIIANNPVRGASPLVSKVQLEGDTEIDFDFMTSKGSSSAVYLLGRYKIQLSDSWPKTKDPLSDMGLIDVNISDMSPSFRTRQPLSNVVKAPGLWQNLKVKFRAPTFDGSGKKLTKASFEEVYLNGVLIHQEIALEGPSAGAMFTDEKAQGPLVFQGDESHVLAFKNISYQSLASEVLPAGPLTGAAARRYFRVVNPILLNPGSDPYVLRSYLMFDGNKRTHVLSVGNPNQTNYSYDLKQGSMLQFWRGHFVDVTGMWESRGEPQLATPLGAVTTLSSAPSFALLTNLNSVWPDSIPFDEFHNKGYSLDDSKNPTFHYEYNGFNVDDKISMVENGESLKRELKVTNAPANLFFRVASGKSIESLGKGLYLIDGKSYYIKIDERLKPTIRKLNNTEELVVAINKNVSSLEYSIIF